MTIASVPVSWLILSTLQALAFARATQPSTLTAQPKRTKARLLFARASWSPTFPTT